MSVYAWLGSITGASLDPLNFIMAFIIGATARRYVFAIMGALVLGIALSAMAYDLNRRYGGLSPYYVPSLIISTQALTSVAFGVRHFMRKLRLIASPD